MEEEEEAEGLLKCLARAIGPIVSALNGRDVKEGERKKKRRGRAHASTFSSLLLSIDAEEEEGERALEEIENKRAIVRAVPEVCFLCIYYRGELREGCWMVARAVYIVVDGELAHRPALGRKISLLFYDEDDAKGGPGR